MMKIPGRLNSSAVSRWSTQDLVNALGILCPNGRSQNWWESVTGWWVNEGANFAWAAPESWEKQLFPSALPKGPRMLLQHALISWLQEDLASSTNNSQPDTFAAALSPDVVVVGSSTRVHPSSGVDGMMVPRTPPAPGKGSSAMGTPVQRAGDRQMGQPLSNSPPSLHLSLLERSQQEEATVSLGSPVPTTLLPTRPSDPTTVALLDPAFANIKLEDLLKGHVKATEVQERLFQYIVASTKQNVVVQSATSSGKTTLLVQVASKLPPNFAFLLLHPNLVQLQDIAASLDQEFRANTLIPLYGGLGKSGVQAGRGKRFCIATQESWVEHGEGVLSGWQRDGISNVIVVVDEADVLALATYRRFPHLIFNMTSQFKVQYFLVSATFSSIVRQHLTQMPDIAALNLQRCVVGPQGYMARAFDMQVEVLQVKDGETVEGARGKLITKLLSDARLPALVFVRHIFDQALKKKMGQSDGALSETVKQVEKDLTSKGLVVRVVHSGTMDEIKRTVIEDIAQGTVHVVLCTTTLERTDMTGVQTVIIAQPPESTAADVQMAGRVSRGGNNQTRGRVIWIHHPGDAQTCLRHFRDVLLKKDARNNDALCQEMEVMAQSITGPDCMFQIRHFAQTGEMMPPCTKCPQCISNHSSIVTVDGASWVKEGYEMVLEAMSQLKEHNGAQYLKTVKQLAEWMIGSKRQEPVVKQHVGIDHAGTFGSMKRKFGRKTVEIILEAMLSAGLIAFDQLMSSFFITQKGKEWKSNPDAAPLCKSSLVSALLESKARTTVDVQKTNPPEPRARAVLITTALGLLQPIVKRVEDATIFANEQEARKQSPLYHPKQGTMLVMPVPNVLVQDDPRTVVQNSLEWEHCNAKQTQEICEIVVKQLEGTEALDLDGAVVHVGRCQGVRSCPECNVEAPRTGKKGCENGDHQGQAMNEKTCGARIVTIRGPSCAIIVALEEHSHGDLYPYKLPDGLEFKMESAIAQFPNMTCEQFGDMMIVDGKYTLLEMFPLFNQRHKLKEAYNKVRKTVVGANKDTWGDALQVIQNYQAKGVISFGTTQDPDAIDDEPNIVLGWAHQGAITKYATRGKTMEADQTHGFLPYLYTVTTRAPDGTIMVIARALMTGRTRGEYYTFWYEFFQVCLKEQREPEHWVFTMDFDQWEREALEGALITVYGEDRGREVYINSLRLCVVHWERIGKKHSDRGGYAKLWSRLWGLIPHVETKKQVDLLMDLLVRYGRITRDELGSAGLSEAVISLELREISYVDVQWAVHEDYIRGLKNDGVMMQAVCRALQPEKQRVALGDTNGTEGSHRGAAVNAIKKWRGKKSPVVIVNNLIRDEIGKLRVQEYARQGVPMTPYSTYSAGSRANSKLDSRQKKQAAQAAATAITKVPGRCTCRRGCTTKRCACFAGGVGCDQNKCKCKNCANPFAAKPKPAENDQFQAEKDQDDDDDDDDNDQDRDYEGQQDESVTEKRKRATRHLEKGKSSYRPVAEYDALDRALRNKRTRVAQQSDDEDDDACDNNNNNNRDDYDEDDYDEGPYKGDDACFDALDEVNYQRGGLMTRQQDNSLDSQQARLRRRYEHAFDDEVPYQRRLRTRQQDNSYAQAHAFKDQHHEHNQSFNFDELAGLIPQNCEEVWAEDSDNGDENRVQDLTSPSAIHKRRASQQEEEYQPLTIWWNTGAVGVAQLQQGYENPSVSSDDD